MRRARKVMVRRGAAPKPAADTLLVKEIGELVSLAHPYMQPRTRESMRELGILEDAAIFCRDGRIEDVGGSRKLENRYGDAARVVSANGHSVVPGFVDAHTHLVFAGSREAELGWKTEGATYREIAERGGGLLGTVRATRDASLDDLVDQSARRLMEMLKFGTTTAEAKSGYGLTLDDELRILEAIDRLGESLPVTLISTFLGAHAVPPEYEGRADEYVSLVAERMIPEVARRSAARFCDVWVEEGYFSADDARVLAAAARSVELSLKLHADELSDQGGASLAAELGAVSADHLIHANRKGLGEMASAGTIAVLLPGTSFASGLPYADARTLIDLGVPVALGTDLSPNSWVESMQLVLSLATHKSGMRVEEALVAATVNAAHAIRAAGDVGTIEPGKHADFLVLFADTYRHLGYRLGGNLVEKAFKDGQLVVTRAGVR